MSDRVRIIIEAEGSDAIRELQNIARQSERTGQTVERSNERQARSYEKLKSQATAVGAAVGTAVSALSLAGRAAVSEERQILALERAYGDAADQIVEFAGEIQRSTVFSDDAARQAALTASSLVRSYGITADQAQRLVEVSADLASVYGIDLADATQRVTAAIRGEGESAEALGLNLSDAAVAAAAAAAGFTTYATTATEAEKATFRYNLLLEQTALFAGAAGEQAQTTAGQTQQLVNRLQDGVQSIGAWTGGVGEATSVLADYALALPLVTAGIGRMGAGAVAAARSVGTLALATGPVGLALGAAATAAGLVALAYREMRQEQDNLVISTAELGEAATDLTATLSAMWQAGVPPDARAALRAAGESLLAIGEASNALGEGVPDRLAAINAEIERLNALAAHPNLTADQVANIQAQINALRLLQEQLAGTHVTEEQFAEGWQDLQTVLGDSSRINFPQLTARVAELDAMLAAGVITGEEYLILLDQLADSVDSYGLSLDDVAPRQQAFGAELGVSGDAVFDFTGQVEFMRRAVLAVDDLIGRTRWGDTFEGIGDRARAGLDEATDALARMGAEIERINLGDALAGAGGGGDAALAGMAGQLAAVVDAGAGIPGVTDDLLALVAAGIEGNEAYRDLSPAVREYNEALRLAADGVLTLNEQQILLTAQQGVLGEELGAYRAQLSATEEAERILRERQAAGIALTAEQIDFLNRVDAAQASATGSAEDLAIEQGILALAWIENAEAQDNLAASNETLNASMVELTDLLGDFIADWRELLGLPPADNLAAPESAIDSWHRMGEAAKDALAAMARGSQNAPHPSPSGLPIAPANQPPPSQDLLMQTGFQGGGTAVTSVVFDDAAAIAEAQRFATFIDNEVAREWIADLLANPEDALADAEQARSTMRDVVGERYEADLLADPSDLIDDVAAAHAELTGLDGRTANAYVNAYADIGQARADINSLTGFQGYAQIIVNAVAGIQPNALFAHGGVVDGAANGRIITVGEAGPERVLLPIGSLVRPAPATRGDGHGGGGITVNINAPVFGVDDLERHIFRALAAASTIGVGNRRVELGIR